MITFMVDFVTVMVNLDNCNELVDCHDFNNWIVLMTV